MPKARRHRKPLPEIKCSDTKCNENLHSYRHYPKKPKGKEYEGVPCHACGDDSIDWAIFRKRDLSDIKLTFDTLRKEYIRFHFWNLPIDNIMRNELFQKGKNRIEKEIEKRLLKSVKKKGKEIFRDSTQTPILKYNIIYFAQHATATCCRKCIQIWHNIPYDKELEENEIKYLKSLILAYIEERVPNIPKEKPQLKLI